MNGSNWKKLLKRMLGLVLILDGLSAALFGNQFLRWQSRNGPRWYRRQILPFFFKMPEPLLRLKGVLQTVATVILVW